MRRHYRFQVQGPNAPAILERLNGGPVPEIKFFNMDWITVGGTRVRALRHGMAGVPGLELYGPYADYDRVRDAIMAAGDGLGLVAVGARAYATNTLESGWIPSPLPGVYTGEALRGYREWLPADVLRGDRLDRWVVHLRRYRGLLPDPLRPRLWHLREVRPRLHRPRGTGENPRPARTAAKSPSNGIPRT